VTRETSPPNAAPPDDLLASLAAAGPALAWADARGQLRWCSDAFSQLFDPAARAGRTLAELLGADASHRLLTAGALDLPPPPGAAGAPSHRLHARPAAHGSVMISAHLPSPVQPDLQAQWQAERQRAERLQERLALVQEFGQTGVFERDPVTLQGHWDRQMFRIWGLPEPAAGDQGPPYEQATQMIFPQDQRPGGFARSMTEAGPHSHRMRIRRPDGQVRHLHSQWKVITDDQGGAQRVVGVNTDETRVYELATQAERLRTELDVALELGGIARWRHDLGSGRIVLDERGCAVIGVPYSEEGITLAQARARIHPDDLPLVEASVAHTLHTGEPSDMQLRYPRPGGGWRHVLLRRALQQGPDGQPAGFVGVLLDVTDRVEEGQRALESARRLEAAAEAARIGLWSTELGTRLPRWNHRMYTLFGLDPTQPPLPLDSWLERCVHADDRSRLREAIVAWWRQGQGGVELDFRIVRPCDGEQRWMTVRGEIARTADGTARRAEGVLIDVTEQQQTLRRLRQTLERLTLTATTLGLGTWEADPAADVVRWDEQMFRLRGVESAERVLTRGEAWQWIHPDDRARMLAEQTHQLGNAQPWHNEFRVCRPDGRVRWITSKSVPILDERGHEERRIGLNWDSTESHGAAQALRERELAVAESQAKSQAMSRISHELRTPLNAVLGFTQLLRTAPAGTGDDRRTLWLGHIEDAARHLLALIDDVLELSRAQVGALRVDRQAVPLAPLVDATLPLLAGEAQARQVQLSSDVAGGVALADPVRLRQVLINLLTNAIKYNRAGGRVHLSSHEQDGRVSLQVTDSGLGIAPERLRHAFEPFNRLGAEASAIEGSGIGLAVVKMLVEHMGGSVAVHSQPGQGSTFVVWLPSVEAGGDRDANGLASTPGVAVGRLPSALPAADLRPASRVLYIEDNDVNALLVREILSGHPAISLVEAADGRSGLALAERQPPDLVLVDMQLPDIDGMAVLRALRSNPRTADIPCVVLSANATPADVEAARAAGFSDYWTKPIDFGQFLAGLARMLGRPV
jgi:PAS domain S-box-containing protein